MFWTTLTWWYRNASSKKNEKGPIKEQNTKTRNLKYHMGLFASPSFQSVVGLCQPRHGWVAGTAGFGCLNSLETPQRGFKLFCFTSSLGLTQRRVKFGLWHPKPDGLWSNQAWITSFLSLTVVTHSQSSLGAAPLARCFAKGCKSLRDERFISVHYPTWAKAVNSERAWRRGFYPCCEFCSWVPSFTIHTCWSNGPCQNRIQFIFDTILRPFVCQHSWAPRSKLSPVLMV